MCRSVSEDMEYLKDALKQQNRQLALIGLAKATASSLAMLSYFDAALASDSDSSLSTIVDRFNLSV